jgi:mRNA interferase MazF
MRLGDLVLLRMEFHQTAGGKVRPAIVLLDAGDDDFVAAPVTSRPRLSEYDLPIQEWKTAGLNVPSFSCRKSGIVRKLGSLTRPDRDALVQILARAFQG